MNTALASFAAATNNDLFDVDYDGGTWMVSATETNETIEDFVKASSDYKECSGEKLGEIGGFKFVAFESVQVRAGDKRRQLSIIDLGDVRYAIDADLTEYV